MRWEALVTSTRGGVGGRGGGGYRAGDRAHMAV
jgi:hypothetical protein